MRLTLSAHYAASPLSGQARYLHWGVFQISLANLVIIGVMVLLFAAALLVPFPGPRSQVNGQEVRDEQR